MKKRHIALFAGLGGFIVSCNRRNIETVFANDFENACVKTLESSFQGLKVSESDIARLKLSDWLDVKQDIDLLSAGFPCQPFSQAGENKGFEDQRGKLFFEIPRICSELKSPPKVLLIENVSHLKIFNKGSRLARVIQALRSKGYWVNESSSCILDSNKFGGSPQRRKRLFIIAYHSHYFKKNYFHADVLEEKPALRIWDLIKRDEKKDEHVYLEEDNKYCHMINKAISEHGENRLYQIRRVEVRPCPEGICPTLTANMGGGGHNVPFLRDNFGIRRLTVNECLHLQGYMPDEIVFPSDLSDGTKLSMIGNAVHPGVVDLILDRIDFSKVIGDPK